MEMSYSKIMKEVIARYRSPKNDICKSLEEMTNQISTKEISTWSIPSENPEINVKEQDISFDDEKKEKLINLPLEPELTSESTPSQKLDSLKTIAQLQKFPQSTTQIINTENDIISQELSTKQPLKINKIKNEAHGILAVPEIKVHLFSPKREKNDEIPYVSNIRRSKNSEYMLEIDHFNKKFKKSSMKTFDELSKFLVAFFQSSDRTSVSYQFKKSEFEILKSIFIRKYKKWIFTRLY